MKYQENQEENWDNRASTNICTCKLYHSISIIDQLVWPNYRVRPDLMSRLMTTDEHKVAVKQAKCEAVAK